MKKLTFGALVACAAVAAHADDRGLSIVASPYGMDQTVQRVESALQQKGVTVFAVIDHAAQAQAVGMALAPTKLLIVGNPKAGTPWMQQDQSVGIDLPLKLLIWQSPAGVVKVGWNSPEYLIKRHMLLEGAQGPLAALGGIVSEAMKP